MRPHFIGLFGKGLGWLVVILGGRGLAAGMWLSDSVVARGRDDHSSAARWVAVLSPLADALRGGAGVAADVQLVDYHR